MVKTSAPLAPIASRVAFFDQSVTGSQIQPSVPQLAQYRSERTDPTRQWAQRFDDALDRAELRVRSWASHTFIPDDDIELPSRKAILAAFDLIDMLRSFVMDRVLNPDVPRLDFVGVSLGACGEVCLELGKGNETLIYQVESDGSITNLIFRDNILIHREVDRA
jgi:hypothetical protein